MSIHVVNSSITPLQVASARQHDRAAVPVRSLVTLNLFAMRISVSWMAVSDPAKQLLEKVPELRQIERLLRRESGVAADAPFEDFLPSREVRSP